MAVVALSTLGVAAETHTVRFTNNCSRGTPKLVQSGNVLHSGGGTYTRNGPLTAAIAYLDVGCKINGENCATVETTLKNPTSPGAGSSTDVTLITPHKFSVKTGFKYYNGCDGQGKTCSSANCCPINAFCKPDDYQAQVQCQTNNVNLEIIFC
ncbi:hypothetical protein RhiJN_06099 [Ceratobasidium sp. AG-Ba]|nr:hypothetical protein RhiJN_06099 [Ceratobasidium sp. AG-Ba]